MILILCPQVDNEVAFVHEDACCHFLFEQRSLIYLSQFKAYLYICYTTFDEQTKNMHVQHTHPSAPRYYCSCAMEIGGICPVYLVYHKCAVQRIVV